MALLPPLSRVLSIAALRNKINVLFVKKIIHNTNTNAIASTLITTSTNNTRKQPRLVNFDSYASLLDRYANRKSLAEGKQLHAQIIMTGIEQHVFLSAKLVSMYSNCGYFVDASLIFDKIPKPNILSWNAMIRGYVQNGRCEEALPLYYQMQTAGLQPDSFTFPFVLKACAGLGALQEGKDIHDCIIRNGLESNVYVGSALIDMYAKCGCLERVGQVFDKISQRNVVSWTSLIAGYAQNGRANDALEVFRQMQLTNSKPNSVTMTSVLPACVNLEAVHLGKEIHGYIIKNELGFDVFTGNALIDMYAKCSTVDFARNVFDKMCERNVPSWNAMLVGYTQNGNCSEALKLFYQMQLVCLIPDSITWNAMISGCAQNVYANEAFKLLRQMQLANVKPTSVTMLSVLPLCARLAALQQGKEIHGFIFRNGLEAEISEGTFVGNALIDMYAKCGNIDFARRVFDKISHRDVVSWTAMIAGYGMHGHGQDALTLFNQMLLANMEPNHITFIGVLSACSHAGLVEEGWHYFNCLSRDYCITPRVEHYACMVDLLSRAGYLDEAHDFIKKMPIEPGAGVWGALLGACRIHCNIELGKYAAECLFELEPQNSGNYVLLSNIYAESGRWDDAEKVRVMMKGRGLKKIPGCSWIEIKNRVHAFLVGDVSHPQAEKIYAILQNLGAQMKAAGYVPDTRFALHDG
eukprot:Gb_36433 [translate_table: standard]